MDGKHGCRGSKHDLIQAVTERGISYRQAEHIVTTIFDSVTAAIRRGDSVDIDGFGSWSVVREKPRAWRFGKVITQLPKRVTFTFRGDLTPYLPPTDLAQDHSVTQGDDFTSYVKAIRRFLLDDIHYEDHSLFWMLRWNSGWYQNTFLASEIQASTRWTRCGARLMKTGLHHFLPMARAERLTS